MKYLAKKAAIKRALNTHEILAKKNNTTPENVALEIVKNRREVIENYVRKFGMEPSKHAAELAVQAILLSEGQIHNLAQENNIDYESAENTLMENEIESEQYGYDNWIGGSLLGSITRAGKKGIETINKKKIANGKKPILQGKAWTKLKQKVDGKINVKIDDEGYRITGTLPPPSPDTKANDRTDAGAAIAGIQSSLTKDAIKDWVKNNTLIIALVIFAGIYLYQNKK